MVQLYSTDRRRRGAQLFADAGVLVWAVLCGVLARWVKRSIDSLAEPVLATAQAARSMAERVHTLAEQATRVPAVGGSLANPFNATAEQLDEVVTQANQQAATIHQVAWVVAVALFVIGLGAVLLVWLPRRLRFVREAAAGARLIDAAPDLDLFALRAIATAPMVQLGAISDDPVGAWRADDREAIAALAALGLRREGLSMPTVSGGPAQG